MNEAYNYMKFLQASFNDKLIVGFIGKTLREKSLAGKTLMNCWLFIKFIKLSTVKILCYIQYPPHIAMHCSYEGI